MNEITKRHFTRGRMMKVWVTDTKQEYLDGFPGVARPASGSAIPATNASWQRSRGTSGKVV